jgi:hypothetical protein
MSHLIKVAGIVVLAASWAGIAGCDHENRHRDRVIVVPNERHETRVYTHDVERRHEGDRERNRDRD